MPPTCTASTNGSDTCQLQGPPAQVQLPSFLVEDNPASANEVWLRLHSDPLFAVSTRTTVAENEERLRASRGGKGHVCHKMGLCAPSSSRSNDASSCLSSGLYSVPAAAGGSRLTTAACCRYGSRRLLRASLCWPTQCRWTRSASRPCWQPKPRLPARQQGSKPKRPRRRRRRPARPASTTSRSPAQTRSWSQSS